MAKAPDWDHRIGRRVRLRDLHILFAVVQHGSMAKAGAHLGMTQSAVSQAIAALEQAVNARLLDRTARGVEPTMYGAALLRRGRNAFDELRQGIKEIEFLSDAMAGEVRIGCPDSLAAGIVAPVVERLCRKYPRVVLHVSNSDEMQLTDLQERSVDVVFGRLVAPLPDRFAEDFDVEVLYHDRFRLAAGPRSQWSRRRKVALADLVKEPWILPPSGAPGGSAILAAFRAHGLPVPRATMATFSVHLRNYLAMSGHFIVALPASVLQVNAKIFSLKELPIDLPMQPWPVAIVTLKNRTLSPTVRLFIECARDVAKSIGVRPEQLR
jgi:DNA-binding transcriptional LysR family regulator